MSKTSFLFRSFSVRDHESHPESSTRERVQQSVNNTDKIKERGVDCVRTDSLKGDAVKMTHGSAPRQNGGSTRERGSGMLHTRT